LGRGYRRLAIETRDRKTSRRQRRRLGDFVEQGLLTQEQLEVAVEEQERTNKSLPRILLELGYVTEDQLRGLQARWMGYDFVRNLGDEAIDPAAASLLPASVLRRYRAIPLRFDEGALVVALADPTNIIAIDDIRHITGKDVKVIVAGTEDIAEALVRLSQLDRTAETLFEQAEAEDEEEEDLKVAVEDAPIVKAINQVISQAVQQRASDIHIEPQEHDVRIRYRIDGVLHEVMRTNKKQQAGMISRLKVMSEMNIAEKRIPQDGRVSVNVDGKPIDLRVATLPTAWGEKVVMRILDRSKSMMRLEDLGFLEDTLKRFEEAYTKPYGAIFVTGPTGSGKSTTLYGALNVINDPSRNIITVEDPVEYRMSGLSQVQVHPKAGLTFATALRSILRADPDVVMIGEIRDRETANIGVEAALTGHLVLTTLHTNDAPSAVTRLIEMGVEPYLVASAVDCVLAQRLARRLCDRCKEPYTPTERELTENRFPWREGEPLPTIYRPQGCNACAKTGYRGRLCLVEVMPVTEEIERLVVERRSSDDLRRVAVEQGMRGLRDDGMLKVVMGYTSIDEVLRVVI
jgi:type IV pilus assembly protein PilB